MNLSMIVFRRVFNQATSIAVYSQRWTVKRSDSSRRKICSSKLQFEKERTTITLKHMFCLQNKLNLIKTISSKCLTMRSNILPIITSDRLVITQVWTHLTAALIIARISSAQPYMMKKALTTDLTLPLRIRRISSKETLSKFNKIER